MLGNGHVRFSRGPGVARRRAYLTKDLCDSGVADACLVAEAVVSAEIAWEPEAIGRHVVRAPGGGETVPPECVEGGGARVAAITGAFIWIGTVTTNDRGAYGERTSAI